MSINLFAEAERCGLEEHGIIGWLSSLKDSPIFVIGEIGLTMAIEIVYCGYKAEGLCPLNLNNMVLGCGVISGRIIEVLIWVALNPPLDRGPRRRLIRVVRG